MYIGSVSVYVSDQTIAESFYVNRLGFVKHVDQDMGDGSRWIQVAPPGGQTSIVLTREDSELPSERMGTYPGVVLHTENMDTTWRELAARGVEFTEEPSMQPFGMWKATFDDPDGNTIVLVELPQ